MLLMGLDALATEDLPEPLTEATHAGVDAWSKFAVTGDPAVLGSAFVSDGPQWRQFEAEAAAWTDPPGGEPMRFEIRQYRLRHLDSTTATVWVEVEASRTGFVSEVFGWDFDLILDNGQWRVWTVVPADPPSESAHVAADPGEPESVQTTTSAPPTSATLPQSTMAGGALTGTAADRPTGTRLPALSAWIVVLTVVGVAVAGYMAPRIDRRGEG
jgi:hypothetical protein